jgi:hypothetical protein
MHNALSVINELPSNLNQVALFVERVKVEILSGQNNALEVLKQLRMAQKALDILNSDPEIEEVAQKEHAKHGQKTIEIFGATFTVKETGTKYDYTACKDTEWERYKSYESDAAENRKRREKFLQTLTAPITVVNEETGELETINPAPKTSTTKLSVTLK